MVFEAVIGLEIHVEMNTKSKMFSTAPVTFGKEPNSQVDIFDFGFPGVMPVVNKQAVIYAIKMANALHMVIDDTLVFERKNYFYSDLPKGYQITQEYRPLGKNGYLEIETKDGVKRIDLERLHIEEDTCKQVHKADCSLLDYNRAGIPLLEIVSKAEFKNGEEAAKCVKKIRDIAFNLGISTGKLEEGSLRCDVNISLKEKNSDKLGNRVEIKNLNSFANIEKAIDYEIFRQSKILETGGVVNKETRRFDESKKQTVLMRIKIDSVDYKFFTDPNIPPIKLSKEFIESAINSKQTSMNPYSKYYDECIRLGVNQKLLKNWMNKEVQSELKRKNIDIKQFSIEPARLVELLGLINDGKISNKQGRDIFNEMLNSKASPNELLNKNGVSLLNDEDILKNIINEVLNDNEKSIVDYKNGKDKALGYLVGQVLNKTQGRANPALANKLMKEELQRR